MRALWVVLFSRQGILDCINSGDSLPSTTTEHLSIALFWLYCDQRLQTPATVTFLPSSTGIGTVGQKKKEKKKSRVSLTTLLPGYAIAATEKPKAPALPRASKYRYL